MQGVGRSVARNIVQSVTDAHRIYDGRGPPWLVVIYVAVVYIIEVCQLTLDRELSRGAAVGRNNIKSLVAGGSALLDLINEVGDILVVSELTDEVQLYLESFLDREVTLIYTVEDIVAGNAVACELVALNVAPIEYISVLFPKSRSSGSESLRKPFSSTLSFCPGSPGFVVSDG